MINPHDSDASPLERFIVTSDGFTIDLLQTVSRGSEIFYRQATPDGRGGGFVAASAYLPEHIPIPWNWVVYENTRVFEDADLAGASPRIVGNVYRVSEVLRSYEKPLLCLADRRRRRLHMKWQTIDVEIARYDATTGSAINFQLNR